MSLRNSHLLWWMEEGRQMKHDADAIPSVVRIKGGKTASITIMRSGGFQQRRKYRVSWYLKHSNGELEGKIEMHEPELRRAFGLDDTLTASGLEFAKKHNLEVTTAEPGAYFRLGKMLSLPHPGRRVQGDPNISVFLYDETILAVERFLEGSNFG